MTSLLSSPLILANAQVPNADLTLVFLFIIAVVAIKQISRWHQRQLWHETARIALEKGQPIPPEGPSSCQDDRFPRAGMRFRYFKKHPILRISQGIILASIGVGLYYAAPSGLGNWWLLPVFIGGAQVLTGLLMFLFRNDSDDRPL